MTKDMYNVGGVLKSLDQLRLNQNETIGFRSFYFSECSFS